MFLKEKGGKTDQYIVPLALKDVSLVQDFTKATVIDANEVNSFDCKNAVHLPFVVNLVTSGNQANQRNINRIRKRQRH